MGVADGSIRSDLICVTLVRALGMRAQFTTRPLQ